MTFFKIYLKKKSQIYNLKFEKKELERKYFKSVFIFELNERQNNVNEKK